MLFYKAAGEFPTLRHTFASWLVMKEVGIFTVQKIPGRSTIAMTERYSHLAPEKFKAAAEIFQNGLDKAGAGQMVSINRRKA